MKLSKSDFKVKNLKQFSTFDGCAFSASIYVKGKRAFVVYNNGDGGGNHYDIITKKAYDSAVKFAESLGEYHSQYGVLPYDLDLLIEDLFSAHEEEKRLKKMCKKATIFIPKGESKYNMINHPFDDRVRAFLIKNYPGAEIVNERFM